MKLVFFMALILQFFHIPLKIIPPFVYHYRQKKNYKRLSLDHNKYN